MAVGTLADGYVVVYEFAGSSWIQKGFTLVEEASNDLFGIALAINQDGTVIAAGARQNDNASGTNAGHVRAFSWSGGGWVQLGGDINGEVASDFSGVSVALSDDGFTVAIGAFGNDGSGGDSGHVRVYLWSGSAWLLKGSDIDGESSGDYSGTSVSLSSDGDTVAIGAAESGACGNGYYGFCAGQVRVYSWSGSTWLQKGADIDGETATDDTGSVNGLQLSGDGNMLVVGAPGNSEEVYYGGAVRVYEWSVVRGCRGVATSPPLSRLKGLVRL